MRSKSKQFSWIFLSVGAACVFFPLHVFAAWNLPSCDPDTVGPTDSTCNVAAPLNVSSSSQTKSGQLTIQNTLNAGALVVSSAYSGNGTMTIVTSSGKSIAITHNDAAQSAITVSTSSNQTGVAITQAGTGGGFSVSAAGASATALAASSTGNTSKVANFSSNGTSAVGLTVAMTGTTAKAVDIDSSASGSAVTIDTTQGTATALAITGAGGASTGINVTSGSSGTGIVVNSTQVGIDVTGTQYGVSSVTSGGIGVYGYASGTGTGVVGRSNTGRAGYFYSNTTSNVAVLIQNASTGPSLNVESNAVAASTISYPSGWTAPTNGLGIRATSGNSIAVTGYSTANTGYGVGVYGRGTFNYGMVAYSDSSYGLFANSQDTADFGAVSCNNMTNNCAYLGGGTYAASLAGRMSISTSVTTNPVATIYNTNTTSPYGMGLSVRTMTGSLTAITPDQGTAVEGQAYNGYGVLAYSQNGTAGLYAATGSASGYGGYFVSSGATARSVYGSNTSSTSGYGGYFTSAGSTSTALYVENLSSTSGTNKYGIQTSATSLGGVALQATSNYGKAIEAVSTAGGYGVYVSGAGSASGVDVHVNAFEPGITTSGGTISSSGGFYGGQFYPNEPAGNGVMPNAGPGYNFTANVGSGYTVQDMIYDGSQLWLSADGPHSSPGILENISTLNAAVLHDYDTGIISTHTRPLYAPSFLHNGRDVWAFSRGSDEYLAVNRLDGTTVSGSISVDAVTGYPQSTVFDGSSIWIGTTRAILELTSGGAVNTRVSGTGNIVDIIYADGYIWAIDATNDAVHKVNTSSYADTVISVDHSPKSIVYDGSSIWVGSYTDTTLTRINASTNELVAYDVLALGSNINSLTFDGANIWIGFESQGVGYFNVASASVGTSSVLCGSCTGTSSIDRVVFDGTYVWALDNAGVLYQVPTGSGFGQGEPVIKKGQLVYDTNGVVQCMYVSPAGNVLASTTLTNCQ